MKANTRGSTPGLRLIERFTRAGRDAIQYEVTYIDPDYPSVNGSVPGYETIPAELVQSVKDAPGTGVVYTRTGRPFFPDDEHSERAL